MKIVLSNYKFQFTNLSLVFFFSVLIGLISLGFWQLGRADQKRVLLAKQKETAEQGSIQLNSSMNLNEAGLRYRKLQIKGKYDEKHQFLIDNQIVDGQAGYFVLTPLRVSGFNKAVLINRGWLPLNKNRSQLPDLSLQQLKATIEGRINHFPVVGYKLAGAEIPTEGWPAVVQVVDVGVLAKRLGYPLFDFQVELDASIENGYKRDWKTGLFMTPERHTAYAVQWFALAITFTLLFIWLNSKKINE